VRCLHEAKCHSDNCFVTLTYDDEHLPENGSLDRTALRRFMDRLRKQIGYRKVRYFQCGEYGERFGRPHYHSLLFGYDFADKKVIPSNKEYPEWTSAELDALWSKGRCVVGSVTFESAAYVARYICKKVTGEHAKHFYDGREPEFATMSRRPGIGRGWLDQYANEVYPRDEVITRGFPGRPPRFYDQVLEDVDVLEAWKVRRARQESLRLEDQTEERLVVREKCALAKFNLYRSEVVL